MSPHDIEREIYRQRLIGFVMHCGGLNGKQAVAYVDATIERHDVKLKLKKQEKAMSNETDLDWLARNVHEWPEGNNFICYSRDHGYAIFHEHDKNCARWFTKGQWLTRRAELQGVTEQFKPSIEQDNRLAQEFKPLTSIEGNQDQEMKQDNGWFERGELPPVGVWCEAFGDGAKPEKCKIIAYHKGQVSLQWEVFNGGCLDILELTGEYWKFRPIRTERDELIEIIASNLSGTTGQVVDAILAAGFKLEAK